MKLVSVNALLKKAGKLEKYLFSKYTDMQVKFSKQFREGV